MRVIQVGVGAWGRTWLGRVQRHRSVSLVALCDTAPEALASAREQTGLAPGHCFEDCSAAFEQVDADAVLIAVPPAAHHEVALAALDAGLHVLTEKPLADTMAHGRAVVAAAEAAGLTLMVSQNYRFRPWARTMRRLVGSGDFGAPDSILVEFLKALQFEDSFRARMDHPLVRDMSIHHFDLMRAITGREPLAVYARTWRPSWSWFEQDPCAMAIFEFEGGIPVGYEGTWVTRGRETTWDGYWRVECPEAVIELRGGRCHVIRAGRPAEDTEVEIEPSEASGQTAVLTEFQQAVSEGRAPETNGRDNLRSMAMSFAAIKSSRTGQRVEIASILEG